MSIHYLNEITSDRDRGTWRIIAKITHMWRIIGEKKINLDLMDAK